MVRGEPASGKTTFLRKISFDWASLHGTNKDTQSTEGLDSLKPYTLLIPVILRLVKQGASWEDTVQDQMDFLSDKHMLTLKWLLRTKPEKVIIVMDGLDEFNEKTSRDITNIMKGNKFDKICCVITSRPEAVSRICDWVRIKYREAELKGFDVKHIQDYIEKFFTESKAKGEALCKLIFPYGLPDDDNEYRYKDESNYLLPLARNPGTLCMICTLHEQGRPIGTSREQLYEEFVAFVLSRWEQRHQSLKYKTPRKHILDKYNTVLLKFGQLSNIRDENQKMELSFNMGQVMSIVGEEAMKYGLLYKSHPVSRSTDCEVSFLHKTLQEYLAGYYIVHKEMDSFKEKCENMAFLEAEQSLIRFILHLHLNPHEAAQFVRYLIKSNPTEDLLKLLLNDLLTGYEHEVESEPVIITDEKHGHVYRYEYKFPSCAIRYNQNKSHHEYSKYIKINKQCVKINLPQIQDVQSLGVRGDGEFYSYSDVLVTCCRDCEVNLKVEAHNLQHLYLWYINKVGVLEVEAHNLQKLELRYINKVGVLEVHGAHHRLQVWMYGVNLNGCLSRTGPWMTNLQSLTMRDCSLCGSDLSDLAACFRSCTHRSGIPQTSTG